MNHLNHQGTIKIETDRLILRRFKIEDADVMYRNWASDDEVTKYLTWPTHANVNVTRMVLEDWIQKYNNPDFYNWAIELKQIGELIGNLSVVKHEEKTGSATIGWCMGKRWWGQRIMPEAARAVLQFLFEEVGFNRIAAKHDKENAKSGRVMQKIGMIREGTLRASGKNNQGIVDEVYYSILKDDYEANQGESAKWVWRYEK